MLTTQKGNKALCTATPNKKAAGQACILITWIKWRVAQKQPKLWYHRSQGSQRSKRWTRSITCEDVAEAKHHRLSLNGQVTMDRTTDKWEWPESSSTLKHQEYCTLWHSIHKTIPIGIRSKNTRMENYEWLQFIIKPHLNQLTNQDFLPGNQYCK
jgi:hypothetical protein